jgi:hypothetical protein
VAARGGTCIALALAGAAVLAAVALAGGAGPPGGNDWRTLTPSPLERTEVGAARIGDRIHVVGGFLGSGFTGRMTVYDISEDAWTEAAPLPIAVHHPGVTAHRGRLYLLGGYAEGGPSDRLYSYDPGRDRWKRLPDAPTARAALGLAGLGGRIYAAGGATADTGEFRGLEIYDIENRRWRRGPPMPTGRNHVGAAVWKRSIVVTGGRLDDGTNLDVVEFHHPGRRGWGDLRDLTVPRSGHATATIAGYIVAFGGEQLTEGDSTIPEVELWRPQTGDWEPLAPMPTPRHGLGGVERRGTVFAVEGGPTPGGSFSDALESLRITNP